MDLMRIAVDVGNQRMKLGRFEPTAAGASLPQPSATIALADDDPAWDQLARWLESVGPAHWYVASVNRPAAGRLLDWIRVHRTDDRATLLASGDVPIRVALERPDMVGIDRLLDAAAANRLRTPARPAVVVDAGTAITVDLVSAEGVFLGGAILPGIAMSARALHEFTDLLPEIAMAELAAPPPAVGDATAAAMRAGLFWGAVGAIRELTARLSEHAGGEAELYISGGASPAVAELLGPAARHIPHLTLAGIALASAGRHVEQELSLRRQER